MVDTGPARCGRCPRRRSRLPRLPDDPRSSFPHRQNMITKIKAHLSADFLVFTFLLTPSWRIRGRETHPLRSTRHPRGWDAKESAEELPASTSAAAW